MQVRVHLKRDTVGKWCKIEKEKGNNGKECHNKNGKFFKTVPYEECKCADSHKKRWKIVVEEGDSRNKNVWQQIAPKSHNQY